MKIIVELPNELLRRAQAAAALSGRKLNDMIEEGLRLVLQTHDGQRARPSLEELMSEACGVVDSRVSDLASNPKRLKDFGCATKRNR